MPIIQSPTTLDCVQQRRGTTISTVSSADHHHEHHLYCRSSKRKLDDYGTTSDEEDDDDDVGSSCINLVRMKKIEGEGPSTHLDHMVSNARSPTIACASRTECTNSSARLQFFVRMMSESHTMVFQARAADTVRWLHTRIQTITKIPVFEQRLIYRGKQLQLDDSLGECKIQNDVVLQLVGRMRSTAYPLAWQLIESMVFMVCRLCRGESIPSAMEDINTRMTDFVNFVVNEGLNFGTEQLEIFLSLSAPAALVMLYLSPIRGNKECAEYLIKHFLSLLRSSVPKRLDNQCAFIVLEFCKLLRRARRDDHLYILYRSYLGSLLDKIDIRHGWNSPEIFNMKRSENVRGYILVQEILPLIGDVADKLSSDLASTLQLNIRLGPLQSDIREFTAFLLLLRTTVKVGFQNPISLPLQEGCSSSLYGKEEIELLYNIYDDLLKKLVDCLFQMEWHLNDIGNKIDETLFYGWSHCLPILSELNSISKLYQGAEEGFWTLMRLRKSSLSALIIKFAKQVDDYKWIIEHKDVLNFEARRHLAMMMFPDVKEDWDELHEMLIDRSQLLAESFEYILHADPTTLPGGLYMEFKNEEATGPGVLREWFFLVCQAIFNPQNALFVSCPNDRRRFFPNPASKVDPLHLKYFSFSGRVIALALMNKVHVGVVFDRVFFLQLAGSPISLEDIKDADPGLFSSCKQILEMDADFIDSDALGLTFVREIEELGSRKVVELCPGGKSIVVNSKNRDKYVELFIGHRFVTSISEQVSHFAQGFADILGYSRLHNAFFQSLEPEDLDQMLYGSERAICVEEWREHTEYNGYKETDPQILWFWKILEVMPAEQRKVLLFFWTSVKCLPVEGFRGLSSRLYIYKTSEPDSHLPSSHTCFYQLCFPPYPSMSVMKDRLQIITREHVACSFGNW